MEQKMADGESGEQGSAVGDNAGMKMAEEMMRTAVQEAMGPLLERVQRIEKAAAPVAPGMAPGTVINSPAMHGGTGIPNSAAGDPAGSGTTGAAGATGTGPATDLLTKAAAALAASVLRNDRAEDKKEGLGARAIAQPATHRFLQPREIERNLWRDMRWSKHFGRGEMARLMEDGATPNTRRGLPAGGASSSDPEAKAEESWQPPWNLETTKQMASQILEQTVVADMKAEGLRPPPTTAGTGLYEAPGQPGDPRLDEIRPIADTMRALGAPMPQSVGFKKFESAVNALTEKLHHIEGVQRMLQNEIMRMVEGMALSKDEADKFGDYIDLLHALQTQVKINVQAELLATAGVGGAVKRRLVPAANAHAVRSSAEQEHGVTKKMKLALAPRVSGAGGGRPNPSGHQVQPGSGTARGDAGTDRGDRRSDGAGKPK